MPARASVIYGKPHTREEDVEAQLGTNRFGDPLRCPSSRFTEFDGAMRHELGVPL